MKNILLVGGAGYVGTVMASHLLKKGYKVTIIDNFLYNNQFSIQPYVGDPDFRFVPGDINDEEALSEASKGITDVVLLAGLVGDPITKKYPVESEIINVNGIRNCIDFFNNKNLDKLVFISTCSNYGLIKEHELADESFPLNPQSLYAKAKVSNEKYLLNKKSKTDYTGVVLRFATAFGISPRMRFDLTLSEFIRDIFFGEELLVYDELTWRPYCHVRDFASLLELIINADKSKVDFEVFNAGGDMNNSTKKMIVDEILKHIPYGKISYGSNGCDPRNYKVSFKKIKNILGFEPKVTIQDGIRELIVCLKNGLYADSMDDICKYGNFKINYTNQILKML